MEELYDFTVAHPNIDLESICSSTPSFFQSYIKRNLKNVATWRHTGDKSHPIVSGIKNYNRERELMASFLIEDVQRLREELQEVRDTATHLMSINVMS